MSLMRQFTKKKISLRESSTTPITQKDMRTLLLKKVDVSEMFNREHLQRLKNPWFKFFSLRQGHDRQSQLQITWRI